MVHEIAHELGDLDPANKEKYEANANLQLLKINDFQILIPKSIILSHHLNKL